MSDLVGWSTGLLAFRSGSAHFTRFIMSFLSASFASLDWRLILPINANRRGLRRYVRFASDVQFASATRRTELTTVCLCADLEADSPD
ncbi:unnamed protein product [Protopolystoma xenopodis]|uniref:Uncharacterized protein n=1 Tax=Protopolystoma xenopodis TaxID=117903 RepID=A0A448XAL2_9PLAT|nr:unnamed protein product [Protopolystoma xenopodis]